MRELMIEEDWLKETGEDEDGFFIVNNAVGTNDDVEMHEGTTTASASGSHADSSFDPALILPESSMTAAARRPKRGGDKGANSTLTGTKGRNATSPASRGESHVSNDGAVAKPMAKKQAAKKAVKAIEKGMEAAKAKATVKETTEARKAKATITDTALDSTTPTTTTATSDELPYRLVKTKVCGIKTRNPHGNGVVDKYEYSGKGRGDKEGSYHSRASNMLCARCEGGLLDRRSVRDHFKNCVRKNGNPNGLYWFDHPSIKISEMEKFKETTVVKRRLGARSK